MEAICSDLQLPREAYIKASTRQPQLLYQKPETLAANVRKSAALIDVSAAQFVRAALKQPQLFYMR